MEREGLSMKSFGWNGESAGRADCRRRRCSQRKTDPRRDRRTGHTVGRGVGRSGSRRCRTRRRGDPDAADGERTARRRCPRGGARRDDGTAPGIPSEE